VAGAGLLDVLLGREEPTGREAEALAACLDSPAWVAAVLEGVPFASATELLEHADASARALPPEAVRAALLAYPRIGERPGGSAVSARMSRAEQSGVASDPATAEALARGNAAYEERFGHVFLVRAAGLGADDVLEALQRRLAHDPATELAVAGDQLRQIALLRLQAVLADDVPA
jgi:2-oxo-4-hydroxy-4-carboxy-5-ureidoimidazoline decarboxylase